jgi:hypothetical protein
LLIFSHTNRFLDTWEAHIEKLTASEALAILSFLSTRGFRNHPAFAQNIQFYKQLKVLPQDFSEDCVLGSVVNTLNTLHSLIGIYFKKLPVAAHTYQFVRALKEGKNEPLCWIPQGSTPEPVGAIGPTVQAFPATDMRDSI